MTWHLPMCAHPSTCSIHAPQPDEEGVMMMPDPPGYPPRPPRPPGPLHPRDPKKPPIRPRPAPKPK